MILQKDSYKGKLLIAKPHVMRDNLFAGAVVYLYEHAEEVVMGLILNKPSTMKVADVQRLRGEHNSGASGHLYKGGPVSEQSLLLLHSDEWGSTNTLYTSPGLAVSSDELMLEKMLDNNLPNCWRLMSGMSTWTNRQLHDEIYKHKAWLLVDVPSEDIFFSYDQEEQWKKSIELASARMIDSYF